MAYVFSSPWTDAAEVGRGIGDRLAEALIQLPAIRAKMALSLAEYRNGLEQQKYEREQREKEFGLRKEQVEATQSLRQESQKSREAYQQSSLDIRKDAEKRLEDNKKTSFQTQEREATMRGQLQRSQGREQQIRAAAQRQHARDLSGGKGKTGKKDLQTQIITNAQEVFKKTKDSGLARKYIKEHAQSNGVTIDPFAVDFGE